MVGVRGKVGRRKGENRGWLGMRGEKKRVTALSKIEDILCGRDRRKWRERLRAYAKPPYAGCHKKDGCLVDDRDARD